MSRDALSLPDADAWVEVTDAVARVTVKSPGAATLITYNDVTDDPDTELTFRASVGAYVDNRTARPLHMKANGPDVKLIVDDGL